MVRKYNRLAATNDCVQVQNVENGNFPWKAELSNGDGTFSHNLFEYERENNLFLWNDYTVSSHCLSFFMTCRMSLKDLVGSITRRRGITLTLTPFSMGERKQKMESSLWNRQVCQCACITFWRYLKKLEKSLKREALPLGTFSIHLIGLKHPNSACGFKV